MKMKTQWSKTTGCSNSSSKREVYCNTTLPQDIRIIPNKQPILIRKATRERRTKPKVSRKKEIIKIRADVNEIEMKKTIGKTNQWRSSLGAYSRLRSWYCHFSSLGPCYGTGLTPGPGTSTNQRHGQKKKRKKKNQWNQKVVLWKDKTKLINL